MTNILVPIDFSATSKNAALFAVSMAKEIGASTLTFFHLFEPIAAGTDGSPLDIDQDTRRKVAEMGLQNLANDLSAPSTTRILAEPGAFLIDNLAQFTQTEEIDIVVMGITGASQLDHILMGSNALKMANEAVAPVLIIPPDAHYKGLNNIVFATDMQEVRISTPINQIKAFLSISNANLQVVHVDTDHQVTENQEYRKGKASLEEMLQPFSASFHFIREDDFLEGLDQFTTQHPVDCIITVPRSHSFLANLFVPHHTRKLAYHTHIPLLAIHD